MKVQDILRIKGAEVFTIRPHQTLLEASQILVSRNVGALVVVDDRNVPLGILSERDIVRQLAKRGAAVGSLMIEEVMTILLGLAHGTRSRYQVQRRAYRGSPLAHFEAAIRQRLRVSPAMASRDMPSCEDKALSRQTWGFDRRSCGNSWLLHQSFWRRVMLWC